MLPLVLLFAALLPPAAPRISSGPGPSPQALAQDDEGGQDGPNRPRHVVMVVSDDQGLEMGCYGHPVIDTPHLDALAAESTRFLAAFCTTASCSASRSVILSGQHNHRNGQYGHQHSYHHFQSFPEVRSLPRRLGEAGWHTARVGKLHVAPDEVYPFETVLSAGGRNPVAMAQAVDRFLDQRTAEGQDSRPLFLWFCPNDPHRGGGVDESVPERPDRFGNRDPDQPRPGIVPRVYRPADMVVPAFLPDRPECRAELAQYCQSVSRVDQGVGALVASLERHGLWEDTLLLFLSDHGVAFAGAKTTVYEPGLHCPLIVRDPTNSQRPATCRAMVSWVDLCPTVLDFAGLPAPAADFDGRSFLTAMRQQDPGGWDTVHASHTFHEVTMYYPMRVVRERRYKLIFNLAHQLPYPFASDLWASPTWQACLQQGPDTPYGVRSVHAYIHRPRFELYDLQEDPDESRNLAADPRHAALLARLQADLRAFQERTADPWALKWDHE